MRRGTACRAPTLHASGLFFNEFHFHNARFLLTNGETIVILYTNGKVAL